MAYRDDILSLGPDHYWTFDNTPNDIGSATTKRHASQSSTNNNYNTVTIAEDSTHSRRLTANGGRFECPDNAEMNTAVQPRRTMGGWIRVPSFATTLTNIFKEGGGTNNFAFVLFPGNAIMCQAQATNVNPNIIVEVFGNKKLKTNRPYHICFRFAGSTSGAFFEFYIDGIKQDDFVGNAPGVANFPSHSGDNTWGDSDSNLRIGSQTLSTDSISQLRFSHWATWTSNLTPLQIRGDLVEKGALPDYTVTSQTELDALSDTTLPDWPLSIRVDVTGNIDLEASNIIFDVDTSIHVQYTGTGTLNWKNSGTSNASIVSTPNGGTVNIINTKKLTLNNLKNPTKVYLVDTSLSETHPNFVIDSELVITGTYQYIFNQGSNTNALYRLVSLGYKVIEQDIVLGNVDLTIPIAQQIDREYENA